ncbi:hypothetical protein RSOLAG1IB_09363 [Rhizoctonia solani AG-1 IB]|uniref:Uncharacterized protein n=1 Tax=Thanatephorus cucumeris (strain AG1-IB / isolate 7/3/14) TaxID=1108050 RepID=M5CDY0_THACB|nr:hypothetical protein BN14_08159 [Rhizoctonia solani AG-1 IB]CEL60114.1 hypothetical protein RSOLAG1IB_09363 [Rhizoctonia solani AG-1 IB]
MAGPQRVGRSRTHADRRASAPYPPPPPPPPPPSGPLSTPEPEGDEDGDENLPFEHPLDSDQSPLPTDARQLTRMTAMFWSARNLLNAGNQLHRASDNGSEQTLRATASNLQKQYFELCDELDRLQPDLFDLLASKGSFFMRNVRDKLSDGRTGAKAEDNHKVKHALPHMKTWEPSLKDEPKSNRGLAHPECAFFLSPVTVDWDDEEQRRQFQEFSNPPMVASHWPRLLYPNGLVNRNKPSEGLLQGELLVMAARVILESPSSVLPSVNIRPGAVRRGRKGIAAKYQLTHITPQFLAYVAVVTRFAVSAEEVFSDDGGVFNYIDFYDQVREYLEAPRFQVQAQVLIAWWNRKLFPNSINHEGTAGDAGEVQDGMLSLLEAELEADSDHED